MAVKGCPVENHYTIISSIINKNIACVKLSGGLTGQGSIVVTVVACVQYMAQELLHAAGTPPYPKSIAYINGIGIEMIKNLSGCVYMKTCAQMFIAVSSEKKKNTTSILRIMFYLADILRTSSPVHRSGLSDCSEGPLERGRPGEPGYVGVFATKTR